MKQVAIRLVDDFSWVTDEKVENVLDVLRLLSDYMRLLDKECVVVVNISPSGNVINYNVVSMGKTETVMFSPKEIFKSAILSNATAILLIHNHPSGDITPSEEDIIATNKIKAACDIMEIKLLDHVIVGGDGSQFVSLRESRILEE